MKFAINGKVYFEIDNVSGFKLTEDRVELCRVGPYTLTHDCLSMIEMYQRLFEVNQCLLKTHVRSTYVMLHEERNRLTALIQSVINAHK